MLNCNPVFEIFLCADDEFEILDYDELTLSLTELKLMIKE